jgi:ribosomal protein S18 acetylase RimI-like enzyme
MKGYIPENILVYIAVNKEYRGKGIGGKLIDEAIKKADGEVALHVEYDNPAKRLYERKGFESKYAEMRLKN